MTLVQSIEFAVLVYFVFVNGLLIGQLLLTWLDLRRERLQTWLSDPAHLRGSELAPRISVIAPAYCEAATIAQSTKALLALGYPQLEVVVVNDGSPDGTLAELEREFGLEPVTPIYRRTIATAPVRAVFRSHEAPALVVVDKWGGGKADALNVGLCVATGELVCAIDADTIIDPDALVKMVRPFLDRDDVVAAGGTIRPVNGCRVVDGRVVDIAVPRHPLAALQAVEYLRAFLPGRVGWNRLGGNLIISGAFGLFRRDAMLAVGGYEDETVGEDMELIAALRRHGHETNGPRRVEFVPEPVAWTEVPESLRTLGRQRDRWHRGLADVLWRHHATVLRRRYGALGLIAMPYFILIELLAPVIEAAGLLLLLLSFLFLGFNEQFALLFLLVAYGLGLLITTATILTDELTLRSFGRSRQTFRLLVWALIEPLGFRQLTVLWRLRGLISWLRGDRQWGQMTRRGFSRGATPPDSSETTSPSLLTPFAIAAGDREP